MILGFRKVEFIINGVERVKIVRAVESRLFVMSEYKSGEGGSLVDSV